MENDIKELLKQISYEQKKELLNFLFALKKEELKKEGNIL